MTTDEHGDLISRADALAQFAKLEPTYTRDSQTGEPMPLGYRRRVEEEVREAIAALPALAAAPALGQQATGMRMEEALRQIALREPQLDSMELSRAFRELREITAIARRALMDEERRGAG